MSDETNQLEKLGKVLGFYQQNLESLKLKLKQQNLVVAEKQCTWDRLVSKLESTQQAFGRAQPSVFALQMAGQVLTTLDAEIESAHQELTDSKRELSKQRAAVRRQMSRIESLEKIVARTSGEVQHKHRMHEQVQSDERYLNTHFTG